MPFALKDKLPSTMLNQVEHIDTPVDNRTVVTIKCDCGAYTSLAARALVRRWHGEARYRCKSCDVKTYARNPEKLDKFRESFSKRVTPEYRQQQSECGKRPWRDPATRKRLTEAVRHDNLTNPKKVEARRVALEALKAKSWFSEHMARMRNQQRESGTSVLETAMGHILTSLNLEYTQHFVLGPWEFDFAVGTHLIEIQGEYWHQDTTAQDSAKATYGTTAGYSVHHIWEHDFAALGKVRETVQRWFNLIDDELIDFPIKSVVVGESETLSVRAFLGAYHYLPAVSKSGYHIGAWLQGELIATATFSSVVRRETALKLGGTVATVRELSRFCIHPNRHKRNFASWFLSRAVKLFKSTHQNIKLLVAFADETAGHDGGIYRASNWEYAGTVKPDYVYLTSDGYYAHKKTIWDRASKLNMTELVYAAANGLVKVNSKQKHKYVLHLER